METVLCGLSSEACLVYLDDIIIVGRTFEEHLNNFRKVFQKLQKANLKLSPKKCSFFQKEEPEGQIARWIQKLQEYHFEIQHRKGTSHGNADALSRRPYPLSSCEIQKAQLEDPAIKPILEKKLNSADRPSWQEIAAESPATKRYWALWDFLHLKDGVLCRRWESDDVSSCRWQLILPKSRIPEVLRETHDSTSGGNFGVMKTLSKTRERFYWDRLRADVEKWCRECHAC
ncbi:hypothetical protein AVEN_221599-1 [Araneus ventricosus]|uniref:RNA-directed DNA polymerase n=1 Tax=Araneus ventricosus TaxID=182803 RepID=A0A4Y2PS22_ARAVE|nr:hypothetical protein AVEN_221599-1 [Araneus ventricosus]